LNAPRARTRPHPDAPAADELAAGLHEALATQQAQLAELQAVVDELQGQPDAEATGRDVAERGVRATLEAIRGIEAALRRIEHGTYGTCERCGAAIPPDRLEAVPHAEHCVRCTSSPALFG
jgi:RNA polymerase-binding transcription factor DksA